MGFIIELLLELVIEGGYEYGKSEKAPRIFRNFLIFAMAAVTILLLWTAFMMREEGMIILLPFGLALLVGLLLYQFVKEVHRRHLARWEEEA